MIGKVNYAEEWDWLIILDSCRYDFFVKNWKTGTVKPLLSLDSCTLEVLNLMPKIPNSICVTSHPFVLMHQKSFDKILYAGWDDSLGTCPPEMIVSKVIKNMKRIRSFKRKIIWFMQPHYPFIGETKLNIPIFENKEEGAMPPQWKIEKTFRDAKEKGILEKAYEDNLKHVLNHVRKLLTFLHGKIVITSDHGEGLGKPLSRNDKPVFSHPCGRKELELRLIPWCIIYK